MGLVVEFKKKPHTQQQVAIESDAPEQLYGGAKRGGKSVWLCQKAFLLNFLFPGNRGLMARLNFTDLLDTTVAEFFETVPSEFICGHNKGERTIFIKNPHPEAGKPDARTKDGFSPWTSRQLYRGLGDPEEFEKVKGINLGHLEVDEPSEVPFENYLMLRAQLTWQLPDGSRPPYMSLLASNPEPGWVEERFIVDPKPGCVFIPALPSDNPHLPPGYVENLISTYPKEWVEKYIRGSWGASEGAVFKELDEEIHDLDQWVDTEHDLPFFAWTMRLDLVGGLDHGSTGTTCYVQFGIDTASNIYAIGEYYEKNRLVSAHALDILALKCRYEFVIPEQPRTQRFIIADPSIWQKTQQHEGKGLQALADLYTENGLYTIPGWNAMEMSIERIKEHLHPIPQHRHPFTGKFGSPSLFISRRRCPNLWKELRGWKRKKVPMRNDAGIQLYNYQGPDHAIDPLRYVINAQPRRREFQEVDLRGLSNQAQFAVRSHAKWAAQFGKSKPSTMFGGFK